MAKRKPLLDPAAAAFIRGEVKEPPQAPSPNIEALPAGQAAKDQKPIRFTLDMDPEQHRRLRVEAANRGVRMSVLMREALDQWFSKG